MGMCYDKSIAVTQNGIDSKSLEPIVQINGDLPSLIMS